MRVFNRISRIILPGIAGLIPLICQAKVTLPSVFADHMVLQQNTKIKIWGWADPWENATVTVSWSGEEFSIKGDANASWQFFVNTPAAGGPYSITVKSADGHYSIRDIMIGEVWICAGQSNMEWSARHGVKDALRELPKAKNQQIRLYKMQKRGTPQRQADVKGTWSVCDSASLYNFSAVGYFFGKSLQQNLDTPIGLLDIAWGGSYIESWIPGELVELYPNTRHSAKTIPPSNHWPLHAGYIYNAMVAPVIDFRFAGVIWYQGESNTHFPSAYRQLQTMMVEHWRRETQSAFPFYYVQIAPFAYKQDTTRLKSAYVREQQAGALDIPGTGMVVVTDQVDNLQDVHPAYKGEVGKRLADYALAEHYGVKTGHYKSPSLSHSEIKGNKIVVTLKDVSDKGLEFRDNEIREFFIAGPDRKFVEGKARITGKNQLEIWSDQVSRPAAARFAFSNAPAPTLFDKSGLPVAPFRTDDWK